MIQQHAALIYIEDTALVRLAQQRDAGAFDELVRRYRNGLLSLARAWVEDREAAEDVVQETLGVAWQKLPSLHDPLAFAPWLRAILLNICRMWRRRRPLPGESLDNLLEFIAATDADPLAWVIRDENRRAWWDALQTVSEENRRVLLLYVSGRYSYGEIAEQLQVPLSTVEGRIQRARRQLRSTLGLATPATRRTAGSSREKKGRKGMTTETLHDVSRIRAMYLFTNQLASVLDAGIAMPHALFAVSQQAPAPYDTAAQGLLAAINRNPWLTKAMAEQDELFPAWYRALVGIGSYNRIEMSSVLHTIADLLDPVARGDASTILGTATAWTPALRQFIFTSQLAAYMSGGMGLWTIMHVLQHDAPEPYADFMRKAIEPLRVGKTITEIFGGRSDLFSSRYVNMLHLMEIGGVPGEGTALIRETIEEEWRVAQATGWQPAESSFFQTPERALPDDLADLTEPQRDLILRWFCQALAMLLSANVPRNLAIAKAAVLLPRVQQEALRGIVPEDTRPLGEILAQCGINGPILALLSHAENTAHHIKILNLAAARYRAHLQEPAEPLLAFTQLFAELLNAGLPLPDCVNALAGEAPSPYAAVMGEFAAQIAGGSTLAAAMDAYPELFPSPYRFMAKFGEDWQRLPSTMKHAVDVVKAVSSLHEDSAPLQVLAVVSRIAAAYFASGINVVTTFDFLAKWAPPYDEAFGAVNAQVMAGKTISDAIKERPNLFPPFYWVLVRSGEYGGLLDEMLYHAADLLDDEIRFAPLTGWDAAHSPLYNPTNNPLPADWSELTDAQQKLISARFCWSLAALPSPGFSIRQVLKEAARLFLPAHQRDAVTAVADADWEFGCAAPLTALGFLPPMVAHLIRIGEPTDRFGMLMSKVAAIYRG